MYNNPYNKYKEARDAAWRVLIDNDIRELPVSLVQIARNNGITIVKDSEAKMLSSGVSGMSILENGKWYIIYNDMEHAGRRRFTIAHELGHIFLGHHSVMQSAKCRTQSETIPQSAELTAPVVSPSLCEGGGPIAEQPLRVAMHPTSPYTGEAIGGGRQRSQEERDADSFAVRLLAPACVLWGLNIRTAEEIQKVCGLSRAAAEHRAKRMEVLYERNKFLTSPLEKQVWENFKEWVGKIKTF